MIECQDHKGMKLLYCEKCKLIIQDHMEALEKDELKCVAEELKKEIEPYITNPVWIGKIIDRVILGQTNTGEQKNVE